MIPIEVDVWTKLSGKAQLKYLHRRVQMVETFSIIWNRQRSRLIALAPYSFGIYCNRPIYIAWLLVLNLVQYIGILRQPAVK